MLPAAQGGDDRHHIPPVQRPAFNARKHLALNPSIKGTEQDGKGRRLRLPRFLYPLDAALKGADACHCGYFSPRWKRRSNGMSGAPERATGAGASGGAGSGMTTGAGAGAAGIALRPIAA